MIDVSELMTDLDYLRIAYRLAETHSNDPHTQNGVIIVASGLTPKGLSILATGANHVPDGITEDPKKWEWPSKYDFIEHAECSAIYDAAKHGRPTNNAIMYCPWFACTDCARAIIAAGISEVVGHKAQLGRTPERWMRIINSAFSMLAEAGVKYRFVRGNVGGVKVRFNGEVIEP